MTDTVTTRIKLPGDVHRDVKAEAARRGINLDQALGACVAYLCAHVVPLSWMQGGSPIARGDPPDFAVVGKGS